MARLWCLGYPKPCTPPNTPNTPQTPTPRSTECPCQLSSPSKESEASAGPVRSPCCDVSRKLTSFSTLTEKTDEPGQARGHTDTATAKMASRAVSRKTLRRKRKRRFRACRRALPTWHGPPCVCARSPRQGGGLGYPHLPPGPARTGCGAVLRCREVHSRSTHDS